MKAVLIAAAALVTFVVVVLFAFLMVQIHFWPFGYADWVTYHHRESDRFYETHDIDSPESQRFFVDDVLFTVEINGANESYSVWVGLYSRKFSGPINIKSIVLEGARAKKIYFLDMEVRLDSHDSTNAYLHNSVKLPDNPGDKDLLALITAESGRHRESGARLKLILNYAFESRENQIEFILERVFREVPIWPT